MLLCLKHDSSAMNNILSLTDPLNTNEMTVMESGALRPTDHERSASFATQSLEDMPEIVSHNGPCYLSS